MGEDLPTPDHHARGWRLAARAAPEGTPRLPLAVEVEQRRLLLLPYDAGGWWCVELHCRVCAGELAATTAGPCERVRCERCGAIHDAAEGGVPVMTVDDEIYVLLEE